MAAVSPILPPSMHAPMPQAHTHPSPHPSPHPLPYPLSLTVSGQGAGDDPHGSENQSILARPSQRHRRRAYPNDSVRWRDERVEMASKPECSAGHRGAKMG